MIVKIAEELPVKAVPAFEKWAIANQLRPALLSHVAFVDLKKRLIYCSEVVIPLKGLGSSVFGRDFGEHGLVAENDSDRLVVERRYPLVVAPPTSILEGA